MEKRNNKEEVPFAHYAALWREMDPAEASARCQVPFDVQQQVFRLTMLGEEYVLAWPEFSVRTGAGEIAKISVAAQILMMRFLLAPGFAGSTGRFLSFRETPWGDTYIQPFTGRCLKRAAFTFGTRLSAFSAAMQSLGASEVKHGDAGWQAEFLPGLFMQLFVWEGDEEFPPNAQILYSDNFPAVFTAEDLVVCADVLIDIVKAAMTKPQQA